jgi:phosphate transport system protein
MMDSRHTVQSYEQELDALSAKIGEMGRLAGRMLFQAVTALVTSDKALAAQVVDADLGMNRFEDEIEDRATLMIAKRQPLAVDLRQIVTAIRVASDLERIGDLAKNIAKRVSLMTDEPPLEQAAVGVQHLAKIALEQLDDVIASYASKDIQNVAKVLARDGELDALYTSLFRELLTYMIENPRNITMGIHLLFCAKNVERVGDHVKNVAETVHYVSTGESLRKERHDDAWLARKRSNTEPA